MASNPVAAQFSLTSLKTLKLRPGMPLQTRRMDKNSPNYEAQFLGVIEGKCLMVVPVGTFSIKSGMKAGETFVVSGFTGQYDFHFTSKVIQAFDFTFREPAFAYAVLSFPDSVDARKVRNALRIPTSLAAAVTGIASKATQSATLLDLSADGSLLRSDDAVGAIGDLVSLEFSMGPDEQLSYVVVVARVCHVRIGDEGYLTGVSFENVSTADRVMIREFVVAGVE